MLKRTSLIIKNLFSSPSDDEIGKALLQQNALLGFASSLALLLAFIGTYMLFPPRGSENMMFDFLISILLALFVLLFAYMRWSGNDTTAMQTFLAIKTYPYALIIISIAMALSDSYTLNPALPIYVILLGVAVVTHQKPIEALILYLFALTLIHFSLYYAGTSTVLRQSIFTTSILLAIIGFLYMVFSWNRERHYLITNRSIMANESKQFTLNKALKEANDQLNKNNRIMETLLTITSDMLSDIELDQLLQHILTNTVDALDHVHKGSILLYENGKLSYRAAVGYDLDALNAVGLNLEDIFQFKLDKLYSPIIINDLLAYNQANIPKSVTDRFTKNQLLPAKSLISHGFKLNNDFYGSINLDNIDKSNAFNHHDERLIAHLAGQIEIALRNKQQIDELILLSRRDFLTGIHNRIQFDTLFQEMADIYQHSDQSFITVIIDLNDLKQINDTYGHQTGDAAILNFVETIQSELSEQDVFARTGGDEFSLILPEIDLEEGQSKLEYISSKLSTQPLIMEGKTIIVCFSYGCARFKVDGKTRQQLISVADKRMYEHKRKIKNEVAQ